MRKGIVGLLCAILVSCAVWGVDTLDVYFVNVGHGDAILISYDNWECLIDSGNGTMEPTVELFKTLGHVVQDSTLELAVLSHNHWDHYGGFSSIFSDDYYSISVFWRSTDLSPDTNGVRWLEFSDSFSRESFSDVEELVAGTIPLAICPLEIEWTVLSPHIIEATASGDNDNENSLILLLTFGSVSFLFPGDIECLPENAVEWNIPPGTLILKAPHHGRTNSATLELVDLLQPDLVIVSTGYSVPEVADAVIQRGIPLFSTQTSGTVHLSIVEGTVWVTTSALSGQIASVDEE